MCTIKNVVVTTQVISEEFLNKVIYKELISIESLRNGLQKIKNDNVLGVDKKDVSKERIDKLHDELVKQTYEPTPTKKVGVPKSNGGFRYLGIPSQIDNVVQSALLLKLQPILESIFINESYGFRPNKNCHTALKEIKYKWKDTVWIIKIEVFKQFDKVNHDFLLEKIKKFVDQATVELIRKLLKAGYVDIHNLSCRSGYETKNSLISPLFCNLYLHELDTFVKNVLCFENNVEENRSKTSEDAKLYSLVSKDKKISVVYPQIKSAVKHNEFVREQKLSATNESQFKQKKLNYVRYADDFMLGFVGSRKEAEKIMLAIEDKLKSIRLNINGEKSKIYHSSDMNITYLGMYLRCCGQKNFVTQPKGVSADNVTKQATNLINTVHFRVPTDKILKKLVDCGIAKKRSDNTIRGSAYLRLCTLNDEKIVQKFSLIIRGLLNYYSCVNQKSDLWKILSCLKKSCALTLGHKHKINSAAKVFARFGSKLKIINTIKKTETILFYPTSLKTKIDFKIGENKLFYLETITKFIEEV